jgi:hypothetical protein
MNRDIVYRAGILMIKKQLAAIVLALWLTLVSVLMLFVERIDLVEFFVLGLIGILVIVELIEPNYTQPGYLRYMKYLIAAGIVIFGAIVVQIAMETLGLVFVI